MREACIITSISRNSTEQDVQFPSFHLANVSAEVGWNKGMRAESGRREKRMMNNEVCKAKKLVKE